MLKWQLIMLFTLEPDWESQMSSQMTAKLELEEALITLGLEENLISLKIYNSLSTFSTSWEVMGSLVFLKRYGRPKILR